MTRARRPSRNIYRSLNSQRAAVDLILAVILPIGMFRKFQIQSGKATARILPEVEVSNLCNACAAELGIPPKESVCLHQENLNFGETRTCGLERDGQVCVILKTTYGF